MESKEQKRRQRLMNKIRNLTEIYHTDHFSIKDLSRSRNNKRVMAFPENLVVADVLYFESQGLVVYNSELRVGRLLDSGRIGAVGK